MTALRAIAVPDASALLPRSPLGSRRVRAPSLRPADGHRLVLPAVAWLLLAPRIDLLTVFGSSVRVDDVVVALLLVPAAVSGARAGALVAGWRMAAVVAAACLSALFAIYHGLVSPAPSLLYAVRPFEYWLVLAALGGVVARDPRGTARRLLMLLAWVTFVQVGVAYLQTAIGLDFGSARFSLERGSGFTGGPYELGAICAALACLWAATHRWLLLVVAVAGVALSESRISMAGLVAGLSIVAVYGLLQAGRRRATGPAAAPSRAGQLRVAGGVLAISLLLVAGPVWSPVLLQGIGERAKSTSLTDEWYFADQRAASTPSPRTSADYRVLAFGSVTTSMQRDAARIEDVSSFIRFYRWNLLLDRLTVDRWSWVTGLGPSFAGSAVDGSYVRVLAETGAVGLLAWSGLASVWVRRMPPWMVGAAVTYLAGAAFIDLLFAMRPTVLMWVLTACALAHRMASETDGPTETGDRR